MAKQTKATTCRTGHVKRNTTTNAVAVRTTFDPDQFPRMVWLIATPDLGALNGTDADVAGWDDVFTPPEPAPVQAPADPGHANP